MPEEAPIEETATGRNRTGEGWFVLNAGEGRWYQAEGRGARTDFEGDVEFPQVGVHIFVLGPGEPMGMYHWEADQEDFLVVSGEGLLIVEGEERPLRQWDFVHCPPETDHIIVGAGSAPCVVIAVGAREHDGTPEWGAYPVEAAARRHDAGVEAETTEPAEAYSSVPQRQPTGYRPGWLPGA
ncbi:MAG TPA: cupin domain-containing protein [Solirubrobacterales bacterium]|nr:cupin domain-containing protein [Solirubrobacterales bacterium]